MYTMFRNIRLESDVAACLMDVSRVYKCRGEGGCKGMRAALMAILSQILTFCCDVSIAMNYA